MYDENRKRSSAARKAALKRKRRLRRRRELLLLCCVAVLLIAVGGTLAYLVANTGAIENTFTPAKTEIKIEEDFEGEIKKNVTVTNNSDYSVYVRATYVAYWVSDADNTTVLPGEPELTKKEIGSAWSEQNNDDYWYYNQKLPAGGTTSAFIVEMTADKVEGRHLVVDVIAETVQAEPEQAIKDVWGFVPTTIAN